MGGGSIKAPAPMTIGTGGLSMPIMPFNDFVHTGATSGPIFQSCESQR